MRYFPSRFLAITAAYTLLTSCVLFSVVFLRDRFHEYSDERSYFARDREGRRRSDLLEPRQFLALRKVSRMTRLWVRNSCYSLSPCVPDVCRVIVFRVCVFTFFGGNDLLEILSSIHCIILFAYLTPFLFDRLWSVATIYLLV